ncbi:transposase [Xanthomonas citri pv. mangiferaeindicae]|nr:transposase [Xanthomonas citri pv. mangiferaeindicae]UDI83446.1 transposase [Xanthomonas citri pv. mangiferaeindicae]
MSINAVQFQAGLSMPEFFAFYGTEAKCYRALYTWRWPQAFVALFVPGACARVSSGVLRSTTNAARAGIRPV